MNYVKLETSDGEVRWINLDLVRRATLAADGRGEPILALILGDGESEVDLRIHGSDEMNQLAIRKVTSRLDQLSQ